MKKKIESFTDLYAWQKAQSLVLKIYTISTEYPKSELYGLTGQMRRSAISVVSNIAEGFSRKTISDREYFYRIALGSLTELQAQLLVSRDLKYVNKSEFDVVASLSKDVAKLLNGLITANKRNNHPSSKL